MLAHGDVVSDENILLHQRVAKNVIRVIYSVVRLVHRVFSNSLTCNLPDFPASATATYVLAIERANRASA